MTVTGRTAPSTPVIQNMSGSLAALLDVGFETGDFSKAWGKLYEMGLTGPPAGGHGPNDTHNPGTTLSLGAAPDRFYS